MNKEDKTIISYYSLLIVLLTAEFSSILLLKNNRRWQICLILLMSVGYLLWGIGRHRINKTLQLKVMLEYTLLSIAVAVLLITLLTIS